MNLSFASVPRIAVAATCAALMLMSAACSSTPSRDQPAVGCDAPLSQRLSLAMAEARTRLDAGCRDNYASLFEKLLIVGEGDPQPENKRVFSEFLVWTSDRGYISPLQARQTYTRYFGTKFVSALSDYNTCAAFCPTKEELLGEMRSELGEKSRGLVNVVGDRDGYARASTLFQELELVISATCAACAAQ